MTYELYEKYKSEMMGKGVDLDHSYGYQCWDGAMDWSVKQGNPIFNCRVTGYAQDIWTQRNTSGILKYYDEVTELEPGDIVVFKIHPTTPLSHIAIFDHDAGNGYGWFFGQNQGGQNGVFNLVKLPYEATYLTAFRSKTRNVSNNENPLEKGVDGSVYRLYNPNTGDHLYTLDFNEASDISNAGWTYEGVGWVAPSQGEPVYRLLNPNDGTHAFAPEKEKDGLLKLGWKLEGVAFYSGGNKPLYRMYNPNSGAHILSADLDEHNGLTKAGWICEGQELKY